MWRMEDTDSHRENRDVERVSGTGRKGGTRVRGKARKVKENEESEGGKEMGKEEYVAVWKRRK